MAHDVKASRVARRMGAERRRQRAHELAVLRADAMAPLRAMLKVRRVGQFEIARELGLSSRRVVWNYLHGKNRVPAERFYRMCALARIDPATILEMVPAPVLLQRAGEHRGRKPREGRAA